MSESDKGATRRDVLRLATVSAPVAAVAMATGQSAEAATVEQASGLKDTAHTRAYYESARF